MDVIHAFTLAFCILRVYNSDRLFGSVLTPVPVFYMMDMPKQKPTLVLMAGFGGSGKTTLAHALGAQLQWPVIDKDVFKSTIVYEVPELSAELVSKLAYELLFKLAREYIVIQQLSVILDTSAIFPSMSMFACKLVQEVDANLKILLCKTDGCTRYSRLQYRNANDRERRQLPVDTSVFVEGDWEYFDHLPVEYLIEIDTSRSIETYLQRALLYLCEERPYLCPLIR